MSKKILITLGLIMFCGCLELPSAQQFDKKENIRKTNIPLSLPIKRTRNGDGIDIDLLWKGFHLVILKHDSHPIYACINRQEEHINVALTRGGFEGSIFDFHYVWWRNRANKFCVGVLFTGALIDRFFAKPPCVKSCNNEQEKSEKKARAFIKEKLAIMFTAGTVLFLKEAIFKGLKMIMGMRFGFVPAGEPAEMNMQIESPPIIEIIGELPPPIECQYDVPQDSPLPHEFNPNLTVVARDGTGLHIIGNEANQYLFTQFYADPNPANLLAIWIQGNWNGFSMGFEIPYGYNKFAPAIQQGANFLPAGGANTRVADGVQVINGEFVLTCGNRVSNDQLLTDADMIHYPIECVRDVDPNEVLPQNFRPELVVLTRRWGLHVIGREASQYRFCQWYADPNPANLPAIWSEGTWDGTSMYFEEPYGYNKFTPAKQQGQDFLPAGDLNTRVSQGVQIINQGFSYTCGQRLNNNQILSDRDFASPEPAPDPEPQPDPDPDPQQPIDQPDHQGLYLERSGNQIVVENGGRWPYILWWAIPNPNYLTAVWLQGSFDGNYTFFDIPQGRNRFVVAETNINPRSEQFYPVGSNQAELGQGIRVVGTDFEIDN